MSRSLTETEQKSLQSGHYQPILRVYVEDQNGDTQPLHNMRGYDWVASVDITSDIDTPVEQATVYLFREVYQMSLAPLIDDSVFNVAGPLIDKSRRIIIKTPLAPAGTAENFAFKVIYFWNAADTVAADRTLVASDTIDGSLTDASWITRLLGREPVAEGEDDDRYTAFEGVIDEVDWSKPQIELIARDKGGELQDAFIEDEQEYGADDGSVLAEDVIRAILDDNGFSHVDLLLPHGSTGLGIRKYPQQHQHVLPALQEIAFQRGWIIRYIYDESTLQHKLACYDPERSKTVPDVEITPDQYLDVQRLRVNRIPIRNVVRVTYTDQAGDRQTVTAEDAPSIAKNGRRFMALTEDASSQINTQAAATVLAESIRDDRKESKAEQEIEMHYRYDLELTDLCRLLANQVHYSADQDLAIVSINHHISAKRCRTTVTVRGTPAGAYVQWMRREVRQGVAKPAEFAGPPVPIGVTATGIASGIVVSQTKPKWTDRWDSTEVHISATTGFTPSPVTLADVGRKTGFELLGLTAGVTYYAKLVNLDRQYNKSLPSDEVSAVAGGISESDVEYPIPETPNWDTSEFLYNVSLRWFPVAHAALYEVRTNINWGNESGLIYKGASDRHTFTPTARSYTFYVRAINQVGVYSVPTGGDLGITLTKATPPTPAQPTVTEFFSAFWIEPAIVTDVGTRYVSGTGVVNVNISPLGYRVYTTVTDRKPDPESPPTPVTEAELNSFVNDGSRLTFAEDPGTTMDIQVTAIDVVGEGSRSTLITKSTRYINENDLPDDTIEARHVIAGTVQALVIAAEAAFIDSAKILNLEADRIQVGGQSSNLTSSKPPNTVLWHFDRTLQSTDGILPTDDTYASFSNDGKYGGSVEVTKATENIHVSDFGTWTQNGRLIEEINVSGFTWAQRITQSSSDSGFVFSVVDIPCDPSTQYTFSLYARLISGDASSISSNILITTNVSASAIVSSDPLDLTSKWQRIVITGTTQSTAINFVNVTFIAEQGSDFVIEIADWQLEKQSTVTPFTVGVREEGRLVYSNDDLEIDTAEGFLSWWMTEPSDATPTLVSIGNAAGDRTQLDVTVAGKLEAVKISPLARQESAEIIPWTPWTHFAWVWDATEMRIYINGVLFHTVTFPLFAPSVEFIAFGNRINALGNWTEAPIANYDEVLFGKFAPSALQVSAWYNLQSPFFDASNAIDASGQPIVAGDVTITPEGVRTTDSQGNYSLLTAGRLGFFRAQAGETKYVSLIATGEAKNGDFIDLESLGYSFFKEPKIIFIPKIMTNQDEAGRDRITHRSYPDNIQFNEVTGAASFDVVYETIAEAASNLDVDVKFNTVLNAPMEVTDDKTILPLSTDVDSTSGQIPSGSTTAYLRFDYKIRKGTIYNNYADWAVYLRKKVVGGTFAVVESGRILHDGSWNTFRQGSITVTIPIDDQTEAHEVKLEFTDLLRTYTGATQFIKHDITYYNSTATLIDAPIDTVTWLAIDGG